MLSNFNDVGIYAITTNTNYHHDVTYKSAAKQMDVIEIPEENKLPLKWLKVQSDSYHSIASIDCVLIHVSTKYVELYTEIDGQHDAAVDGRYCPSETYITAVCFPTTNLQGGSK